MRMGDVWLALSLPFLLGQWPRAQTLEISASFPFRDTGLDYKQFKSRVIFHVSDVTSVVHCSVLCAQSPRPKCLSFTFLSTDRRNGSCRGHSVALSARCRHLVTSVKAKTYLLRGYEDKDAEELAVPDQCLACNYEVEDDPKRLASINNTGPSTCDNGLRPGWYRFLQAGVNALMATTAPPKYRCGANAPVWLSIREPLPAYSPVNGTGCSNWSYSTCYYVVRPITALNCSDFVVYGLPPITICFLRYCTSLPQGLP